MSYGSGMALQVAVHARLSETLAVPVLDAVPAGSAPETYVLIGPEEVRDAGDGTGAGAEHRISVNVVSRAAGFAEAKVVAVQVSDALTAGVLSLARGRVVGLWFQQAKALRLENGALRRVDLTFRARISDQ